MRLLLALAEFRVNHRVRFHVGLHLELRSRTANLAQVACKTTGLMAAHLLFPLVLLESVFLAVFFLFFAFFAVMLQVRLLKNKKARRLDKRRLSLSKQRAVFSPCWSKYESLLCVF